MHGLNTLAPEITHISKFGIWLLFDDEELYLPFETFPWFRCATVDQITHLVAPTKEHLYWPDLDIDLSLSSIRNPHKYPLMDRARKTS